MRPTAMIFREQPNKPWEPYDFKLLEAYQVLQDETCQHCGNPLWLCRSPDSNVRPVVRVARCQGKAALERREKARSDDKRAKKVKDLRPGEYEYVVFEPVLEEKPLPTRSDWLEEMR